LRERIDALARKMEIYVDWPSDRNRDPTVQRSADPLNSHSLGEYDFDCAKYLPNSTSIETLKVDPIPKPDKTVSLQVDWRSTKHHIVALQYCFETVHRLILAARQWAAKSPVTPEMMNKIIRAREKIQAAFDQLVDRLNVADPGYPAPLSDKKLPLPSLFCRAMVCLIGSETGHKPGSGRPSKRIGPSDLEKAIGPRTGDLVSADRVVPRGDPFPTVEKSSRRSRQVHPQGRIPTAAELG